MFSVLKDISDNWKKNKRGIYPEPSIESAYGEQFYHDLYVENDKISFMLDKVDLSSAHNVLDVGCGRGEMVFELAKRGIQKAYGIDLSQDGINVANQKVKEDKYLSSRLQFEKMSATDLQYQDDSFDLIFMADIVEHLSDENLKKAFAEVYRVLQPGGKLVLHTEPTVNYKKIGQYFVAHYFRSQGKEWITPTIEDESKMGHVNIQSKASLVSYLRTAFPKANIKISYAPLHSQGFKKKLISCLGLWSIFSPHLWGIAEK